MLVEDTFCKCFKWVIVQLKSTERGPGGTVLLLKKKQRDSWIWGFGITLVQQAGQLPAWRSGGADWLTKSGYSKWRSNCRRKGYAIHDEYTFM